MYLTAYSRHPSSASDLPQSWHVGRYHLHHRLNFNLYLQTHLHSLDYVTMLS